MRVAIIQHGYPPTCQSLKFDLVWTQKFFEQAGGGQLSGNLKYLGKALDIGNAKEGRSEKYFHSKLHIFIAKSGKKCARPQFLKLP